MRLRKRLVGLGLIFTMTFSLGVASIPSGVKGIIDVYAAEEFVIEDGVLVEYRGSSEQVVIPEGVTKIACGFGACTNMKSLTIPTTLVEITDGGFIYRCDNLESITVTPGNPVFDSRNNCNAIIRTSSNTLVRGCNNTRIPEGISKIEAYAFSGCTKLVAIKIPDSVKTIGKWAFSDCYNLESLYIPAGVNNIEDGIVGYCHNLKSIVVDKDNTSYDSRNNCNAIVAKDMEVNGVTGDYLVAGCKNTRIPDSVVGINMWALIGLNSLREITIPGNVKIIGASAFYMCTGLERVYFKEGVERIEMSAFYGCASLREVELPKSVTYIDGGAFSSCNNLASITITNDDLEDFGGFLTKDCATVVYCTEGSRVWKKIGRNQGYLLEALTDTTKLHCAFLKYPVNWYWYENGTRQGTYDDKNGVVGDGTIRGREIYDGVTDGWYWLDACYNGARAINKEVWMPYIYQDEKKWSEEELIRNSYSSGDMANQVVEAIKSGSGKWVRYDGNGRMYKGWFTVTEDLAAYYPSQVGNTYYYDNQTGLMAKGWVTIDGERYHFNEVTGVLDK